MARFKRALGKAAGWTGRWLVRLSGLFAGPLLTLTLVSYNPYDPTPNTASLHTTQNWLGPWGAWTADLTRQIWGNGAWVLAGFLCLWTLLWLLREKKNPTTWRMALLLPGLACLSTLWAHHEPGAGGAVGDICMQLIHGIHLWYVRLGVCALTVICLGLAAHLNQHQLRKALVSGWLVLLFTAHRLAAAYKRLTRTFKRVLKKRTSRPATHKTTAPLARAKQTDSLAASWESQAPEKRGPPSVETTQTTILPFKDFKKKALSDAQQNREKTSMASGFLASAAVDLSAEQNVGMLSHNTDDKQLSLDLLTPPTTTATPLSEADVATSQQDLQRVLQEFGVEGRILKAYPGPVVTLYAFEPAPGIKSARVIGLADDIARSMGALSARIAVIPGQNALGIELPNPQRETVFFKEVLAHKTFTSSSAALPLALGKDISGAPVVADLARMPHLLVAGTTGSGKSVGINAMILSLLFRMPPEACHVLMVDPKMLELSVYDGIPHLVAPVITEPKKAVAALKWAVHEMERRYRTLSTLGVRNIDGYNRKIKTAASSGTPLTRRVQTGFDEAGKPIFEEEPLPSDPMPYIVVIVDEMADLMLVAGKEIEGAIQRLAQMARAAGIHLIMATQRPSVDVITGTIKANFPARISFQVTSKIDSRTILGEQGAEQLLGQGDMLYVPSGRRPVRVHGAFVSDHDVEKVVRTLQEMYPDHTPLVTFDPDTFEDELAGDPQDEDDLYTQALNVVLREKKASTSFIQRKLQIGYNRAARLMEQMESQGVVSPAGPTGKRTILKEL